MYDDFSGDGSAMTWLVKVALDRPYTFIVMALMILIFGPLAAFRTPTDIFPNIGIPVLGVAFNYSGLSPDEMGARIVASYERFLSNNVNDVEHFESQSMHGTGHRQDLLPAQCGHPPGHRAGHLLRPDSHPPDAGRHPAAVYHQLQRLDRAGAADGLFRPARCRNSRCWTIRRISPAPA